MSSRPPRATIDFETRSAVSIKATGSWKYSLHPSTEVLCLAFRLPHWAKGRTALWYPSFPHLDIEEAECPEIGELFQWVLDGGLCEAHNAWFERGIWRNKMVPVYGWFEIPHKQWRCSAAKASALALPRGLDDAATALGLRERKDAAGAKVMMKLAKPRKLRKKERETWRAAHPKKSFPIVWFESRELFEQLWAYCRQDVIVEEALSEKIPDLSPAEQRIYLLDQLMNERGFALDAQAVKTALKLIGEETTRINQELVTLTDGQVQKASQRQQMLAWFEEQGQSLPDTQGPTLDGMLTSPYLQPNVRRGIELVRALGRSSTAKFLSMQKWMCPDSRIHGGLLYHGASTGRWTGVGVQPHNFPKGTLREKDMDLVWEVLRTEEKGVIESLDKIDGTSADTLTVLSHALRGAITASPGRVLYVADYAAIEARVVLWLAEDEAALDVFRRHEDIYCVMAESIYGYPCNKKDHPTERSLGKIAVLGLGYQMGASKFVATCATYGIEIEEDFARQVVEAYRTRFELVKQMWWAQEQAAIEACATLDEEVPCGRVTWVREGMFLYCQLPSGRRLAYPFPALKEKDTPWGERRPSLTYMGVDGYTHKWTRQTSYGGLLVENITQAVARDIMAEAVVRCEKSKIYQPVLTVHDELVTETHPSLGDLKTFEQMVAKAPVWASDLPIEAEGWVGFRYHK